MRKGKQVHEDSNSIWIHEILNIFLEDKNIFT